MRKFEAISKKKTQFSIEIQEYVKKKDITLCTSTLFDIEVTYFSLSEIDFFFIEFVNKNYLNIYMYLTMFNLLLTMFHWFLLITINISLVVYTYLTMF